MTQLKFIIGGSFENSLRQTNAMKVRMGNPTFILPHIIYFLNKTLLSTIWALRC